MAFQIEKNALSKVSDIQDNDYILFISSAGGNNAGNKLITWADFKTELEAELDAVVGDLTVSGVLTVSDTTDSTSKDTGSVILQGGMGVEKSLFTGLTLNAGTALTVGTNQTFAKEVNHTISVTTTTTAATAGGNLVVVGGGGATSGAGGYAAVSGGNGGATGTGGAVYLASGNGGATSGDSGIVSIGTAAETGTDNTGSVAIGSGTAVNGTSGVININSGNCSGTGASGDNSIGTGNVGTANSGDVIVYTGEVSTAGGSGDIILNTGDTVSGLAGDVILEPGSGTSATVCPVTNIKGGLERQPSNSSVGSGGSITAVQLVKGHITGTGATGNWQLPNTADIITALGSVTVGTNFEFIFNAATMTAANTATLVVGTDMTVSTPVITGGATLTVHQANNVTGGFRVVFDTLTTCKLYRIW